MYLLGINAYHGDSSACIYQNGRLIAATEEERFRRVKHWAGLPVLAISFCLAEAGIELSDVDHICVSRSPLAKVAQKAWYVLSSGVTLSNLRSRVSNTFNIRSIKEDISRALQVDPSTVKATVRFVEHHRCHMASAYYISPFDECAILSVDGMGDFTSTMRGTGSGAQINVLDSVSYPHSLGILYTTFTQYLGFPHYGDEYKLMGLSPYGEPRYLDQLLDEVITLKKNGLFELNGKYFRHFKEGVSMSWQGGAPTIEPLHNTAIAELFGPPRSKGEPLTAHHKDLAASVQRLTEIAIFHMAEDLYRRTGMNQLCLTGGVAQNSMANGKIIRNTSFEGLFVPPAGHDAGTATGAALYQWHHNMGNPRETFRIEPYTGVRFDNDTIAAYLQERNIPYLRLSDEEIYEKVTQALLDDGVIGWFQGRAEFGPRALGNRSILADPRRADAKQLLNEKIKKRESFRPFAPSILEEYVDEYFEQVDQVPFMEKVFDIRKEKHAVIPAVTHVNGTGRLQTVSEQVNPRYYALIHAFYRRTGVPVLLNTSFNENEPIVNTPEHALECFLRTKMDMLVMENIVVSRNGQHQVLKSEK
ncbi:MAG: carbamoyltransferase C-terminal domain-containing protein [Saprospiraceae bacterium]|nr:carbamoyltransferase C-terminal domain-containing protein [Saprospiraceae bacterium]